MAEIVLVTSSFEEDDDLHIPIGVLNIGSILDQHEEYNVDIVDFNYLIKNGAVDYQGSPYAILGELTEKILEYNPNVVGFSCMCNNYHIYLEIAEMIKKISPDTKVLLGGPQATLTAEETMDTFSFIDLIAVGESEGNIISIVKYLLHEDVLDPSLIPGIVYRDKLGIHRTVDVTLSDLNDIPILNYDLIPFIREIPTYLVEGGRGCPYSCTYCSTKTFFKRKYRLRPHEDIIREIKHLYYNYGARNFDIVHDLFTVDKKRIIEFCKLLSVENLDIAWSCSARIDTVDQELAKSLANAGCTGVFLGIESGSEKIQKTSQKGLNIKSTIEKANMLKDAGIERLTFSFIYGFEDEDDSDILDTLNLILDLYRNGHYRTMLQKLTILAGTEMYEKTKDRLELSKNETFMTRPITESRYYSIIQSNPQIFPHFFTVREIDFTNYEWLDLYISHLCQEMKRYFPQTFNLILEQCNDNLLVFYYKLLDMNRNFFKIRRQYFDETNIYPDGLAFILHKIKYLIKYCDFGNESDYVKALFKYELEEVTDQYAITLSEVN